MKAKALELFKAYADSQLPSEGGYIVSSFLDENSSYARYEVVAYSGVKSIYLTEEGLTFQTDGNKLFVLAEPASYSQKHQEPFRRTVEGPDPSPLLGAGYPHDAQPDEGHGEQEPADDLRLVHHPQAERHQLLLHLLQPAGRLRDHREVLRRHAEQGGRRVPSRRRKRRAKLVIEGLKKFTIWNK